ncbi:MAG: flippase [Mailhella sp.]|nr:flippase [Mailhella sp.]
MDVKEFLNNRVVKNAGWLVAGKVIQAVIQLTVGIWTARYLGPADFGLINYAAAYTGFFMWLCGLGINSVLVKELIDNPDGHGTVLGTSLGLKALSSLASAVFILCISAVLDHENPTAFWVVALSGIGVVFSIFDTFNYFFQARFESKVTAIVSLAGFSLSSAYKVALILTSRNVLFFAFAASLDYIFVGLLLFHEYRRHGGRPLSFSWAYGKILLGKSCHFILPALMVAIYGQTDKFMLKQLISETEIGYYSAALRICTMWCFVLGAIIDAMYPSIVEAFRDNETEFEQRCRLLYAVIEYVSFGMAVLITFFAPAIIALFYGPAYAAAAVPLQVLTWYTAFSYLGVARNSWVVCRNVQKYLVWIYVLGAASNVVLNILVIPRFGATGAAAATLITQFVTAIGVPLFIPALKRNAVLMLEAFCLKGLRRD